jgi:hypothetical protein
MNKAGVTIVFALVCLLGSSMGALAQGGEGIVVNVPFEFVAGAKTMSAGRYRVGRMSLDSHSGLIIRGDRESTFLLPMVVDGTSSGEATISFERQEDRYILSRLATPSGVYTVATPPAASLQAHGKGPGGISFSGAN